MLNQLRLHLIALLLGSVVLSTASEASTVFHCACQLSASCATGYGSAEELFARANRGSNSSLQGLTRAIESAIVLLDQVPAPHRQEAFEWQMAEMLVNLHELISAESAFTRDEIAQIADDYRAETMAVTEKLRRALDTRSAPVFQAPVRPGADYLVTAEVTDPKHYLYVSPRLQSFNKWLNGLGGESRKAIHERLVDIARDGVFGDHKPTHLTGLLELRFHMEARPRIYYVVRGRAIVIVGFNLKAEGRKAQHQAIEHAAEIVNTFVGH